MILASPHPTKFNIHFKIASIKPKWQTLQWRKNEHDTALAEVFLVDSVPHPTPSPSFSVPGMGYDCLSLCYTGQASLSTSSQPTLCHQILPCVLTAKASSPSEACYRSWRDGSLSKTLAVRASGPAYGCLEDVTFEQVMSVTSALRSWRQKDSWSSMASQSR